MATQADCLFCTEDEPCVTHADKIKKSSPRKQSKPNPPAPSPQASPIEPTASSDFIVAPKRNRFGGRAEAAATLSEDDRLLKEALVNLSGILASSTKKKYQHLLEPPKNQAQSKRHTEVRRMLDGTV